jgi:hypothetical protein
MKKEESAKKVMQKKESNADGRCPCYISHSDNQNSKLHSSQKASGSLLRETLADVRKTYRLYLSVPWSPWRCGHRIIIVFESCRVGLMVTCGRRALASYRAGTVGSTAAAATAGQRETLAGILFRSFAVVGL